MQFLIGHEEFSSKKVPFDASVMVDFRKRFGETGIQKISDEIIDALHRPLKGKSPRPQTHRKKGRKKFVAFTKSKEARNRKIRKAKRQ